MKYSAEKFDELLKREGIIYENGGWTNSGNGVDFTKFHCYGCLRAYKSWRMARICRWVHKTFTPWKKPLQMETNI